MDNFDLLALTALGGNAMRMDNRNKLSRQSEVNGLLLNCYC